MNSKVIGFFTCVLFLALAISTQVAFAFTNEEVKCLVCKATVQELEDAIAKEDPNKKVEVTGRLNADGNYISKSVKSVKSEMYLTELMEKICEKMDDYVKATYKNNGKLTLLKMVIDGKMNPESSNVDFVQDGDLNKSLAHYCLEILDDQDEVIIEALQADVVDNDLDIQICSVHAKYCKDAPVQDEYDFDDKDEL